MQASLLRLSLGFARAAPEADFLFDAGPMTATRTRRRIGLSRLRH
jgi:hypothetical protein